MAQQVTMPQLGLTMEEGTVFEWSKSENDPVKKGEVLLVVENDKSTVDVESQYDGILGKILVPEGETVPVGTPIAWITDEGEAIPDDEEATSTPEAAQKEQQAPAEPAPRPEPTAPAARPTPAAQDGFVLASPRARALAEEHGLDLSALRGSGPERSVVEADVLGALESGATPGGAAPAPREIEVTRIQALGAERMTESWQRVPQFTLQRHIDAEAVLRLHEHFRNRDGARVSLSIIVAKILAHALAVHPRLNSEWLGEGRVREYPWVHVGIAMDTPNGLMVPVLRDCTTRSFPQLAESWTETAATVRAGKAGPQELSGATVTLSNLGMFGVGWFRAIVNPPQAAILAVGAVQRTPVETSTGMGFRSSVQATVTGDHRVVDGAYAARFMQTFAEMMENPVLIYENT